MEEMEVENEESNEKEVIQEDTDETKKMTGNEIDKQVNIKIDDKNESDSSDDTEDANEAEVKSLEANLATNSYDYGSHVALINKLRKMGELERLRIARENMSIVYPLSPDLWLSWIQDEISCATTTDQKDNIVKLCERAVKDYISVEVWLEYLQFSIGNMCIEKDGAKNVRQLFERALTTVALHTIKGAIIWEAFREFETVLLTLVNPESIAEKKEALERIGNLFRRQLACPLLDMNKTYEEYKSWRAGNGAEAVIDESIVSRGYEQANAKLNSILTYEEKLISTQGENELLDAYKEYLLYEKQQDDPGRITVLYERAITDLSLDVSIWLNYLTYLEDKIKIESVLDTVYQRASRNIPWCSKLWQKWIRSYERWQKPVSKVQILLENALTTGFSIAEDYRNLWMTYLEFLRRRYEMVLEEEEKRLDVLLDTFNKACDYMAQCFGLNGDPDCIILQYWARTEGIHANNMERARVLWADILSQGHSTKASYWLEYIALERYCGDTKHLRKLYHKALASVTDWPESIANSWIDFERDEGNLEQMEICEMKTKEKLEKNAEEKRKIQETSTESKLSMHYKKINKRKSDDTGKWKNLSCLQPKIVKNDKIQVKPKLQDYLNINAKINNNGTESESKIIPPGFTVLENKYIDADNQKEVDNNITVFVSNLDYTATEEEVRDALKLAGPITLFKMIKDYRGRSKGYCYVQLSNAEAVEIALKMDRIAIRGRPMFVSRCDPNKNTRRSGFKYSSTLEKNKLFVKGLPITTTKEELEEIFKIYGALKEVRLVTYRNGHSKGLAYVEYCDEATAAKALLGIDGMKIHGKVISVAISQPPYRKKSQTVEDNDGQIKSLGATATSRTAFGVPKILLSMVPRNVKINSSNDSSNGNVNLTGHGVAQSMSNQDFRNMLLNKK
ncbi:squamous cell carcinoma antigen recognized by T-cells 3 [Harpegnathos saltator]|uniref:Squamous cell carcinoma antigen recognized by T-cells 3 n=1 Tax=Harpegnathos saltator TaxID=610380 RepID=E2BRL0_HARSA|nr:squamous cell carcinoma antigen recognized by T-cells 3 [Harpegnathos saltator]EFN81702.1 Squamous cell carcinoma antigen recognized by T-cells 3 [Harpegnathos saltator]